MPFVVLFVLIWLCGMAGAQEHGHPPQDQALHERFYSTWYMPDQPSKSCCNKQDCYPTVFEKRGDRWYARRREDGKMIYVPNAKFEHTKSAPRDSPDGQNHVCMPGLNHPQAGEVYCAVLGSGQ